MAISTDKMRAMLVTTYQCYNKLPVKDINIKLGGPGSSTIWTIGVIIDQILNCKNYKDKIHKTVSMLLAQFRQMTPFLQMPELITLNHSYFPTLTIVAVSGAMPNLTIYLNYTSSSHALYMICPN